ncbi:MAG: hypothetical protein WDM77_04280 [Steroidobacteraceae bacterium]
MKVMPAPEGKPVDGGVTGAGGITGAGGFVVTGGGVLPEGAIGVAEACAEFALSPAESSADTT